MALYDNNPSVPYRCADPKLPYFLTAYEIAVKHGFRGTEEEWLESLTAWGAVKAAGYEGTYEEWIAMLMNPGSGDTGGSEEGGTISGGTATADLDMDGYKILNLPTPVNPGDAVNKDYADQIAAKIDRFTNTDVDDSGDESNNLSGGGDTIVNVGTPEKDTDAANKEYVDTTVQTIVTEKVIYVETKEDGTKEEHLSGGNTTIVQVATPVENTDAANKEYVDTKVSKAGDTMEGNLNMGGFALKNVAAPTENGDAVNKGYANAIASAHDMVYVNGNPAAAFPAQDIAVSGLSDWDMITISCAIHTDYSTHLVSRTFPNRAGTYYINEVLPGDEAKQAIRTFTFGAGKIAVGNCTVGTNTASAATYNNAIIPVSVHVTKYGKGGGSELPAAEGVEFG